jgi:hypothetical protein
MPGVDGGPLLNASAFFGVPADEPVGPFRSVAEIWNVMARNLFPNDNDHGNVNGSHGVVSLEKGLGQSGRSGKGREQGRQGMIEFLGDRMPSMGPFVFSHGDLAASNIMVQDGQFSGFIDFENSGFYPYGRIGCSRTAWNPRLTENGRGSCVNIWMLGLGTLSLSKPLTGIFTGRIYDIAAFTQGKQSSPDRICPDG